MSVDHVRSGRVTRVHRKALVVSAWLLLGMGLAGCSTRAREHDAGEVAARFVAAVSARDGAAACAPRIVEASSMMDGVADHGQVLACAGGSPVSSAMMITSSQQGQMPPGRGVGRAVSSRGTTVRRSSAFRSPGTGRRCLPAVTDCAPTGPRACLVGGVGGNRWRHAGEQKRRIALRQLLSAGWQPAAVTETSLDGVGVLIRPPPAPGQVVRRRARSRSASSSPPNCAAGWCCRTRGTTRGPRCVLRLWW